MVTLRGKTALVTGGSGTIGKAIAQALLSQGANVVLTGRRRNKLEEAQSSLLVENASTMKHAAITDDNGGSSSSRSSGVGGKVHVIPCDLSKEDSVVALFEEMDQLHRQHLTSSSIDLLVNNGGINIAGAAEDLTAKDLETVLGTNVVGAFLCSREALKRMKVEASSSPSFQSTQPPSDSAGGGGGGRIINIGSISAQSPRPNSVTYTTSKFAMLGLTQSLALDARAHGVAVGIIHPGNVVSDIISAEDLKVRGATEGFLQPEDVAQCVLTMAMLPYSANVLELTVIPTTQPLVGRG